MRACVKIMSVSVTDGNASEPADALLALATPSPPAAVEPPSPLLLTAVPHHVATQRTGILSLESAAILRAHM